MKTKLFITMISSFFLHSCSESNSSQLVDFKDVIGCFHYNIRTPNEYICITSDSVYLHKITDGKRNVFFSETGKIQYNRVGNLNILILLNFSRIEDDSLIYKTDAYFYVRKKWGRITIAHGFNADPDGAPTIPRYKKIK
jgi:hypothetical protein